MRKALQENENQAAEASAVSTELKPGVTIDLSRKGIQKLPEEVVDIIKNELERSVYLGTPRLLPPHDRPLAPFPPITWIPILTCLIVPFR